MSGDWTKKQIKLLTWDAGIFVLGLMGSAILPLPAGLLAYAAIVSTGSKGAYDVTKIVYRNSIQGRIMATLDQIEQIIDDI